MQLPYPESRSKQTSSHTPPRSPYPCMCSRLLEESGDDVRPYIERNRFHPHTPSSSSDADGERAGYPPPYTTGAPAARFSFVQAVELVLTTGPLSRERGDKVAIAPAVATTAAIAASTEEGSREVAAGGGAAAPGGGGGVEKASGVIFEGFEKNAEASVVSAVTDLLREAIAAAERWGLSPQDRDRLRMWSQAAAATATKPTLST